MLTQVALGVIDGHPINARSSFVPPNALPRAYEVLSLAHLLHQVHRCSRAFGVCRRHDQFGPRITSDQGFTPLTQLPSQLSLGVLPQSGHEMSVLLAAPNRSFGPSSIVSGTAYPFSPPFGLECLTSFADSTVYYALC
jgi:hypothetical protein